MRNDGWTPEATADLIRRWNDNGESAGTIGKTLGFSRHSVGAKIDRLRKSGVAMANRVSVAQKSRKWASDVPVDAPIEADDPVANGKRKTIETLTPSCCRWPIGDRGRPGFHFCGEKKLSLLPYCEIHARRAFQPRQPRRRADTAPEAIHVSKQIEPAL